MQKDQISKIIRDEVSRVLGTNISYDDKNFFELGMHSLQIVTLAHSLSDRFNVNLGVRAFFEGPTIGELADVISCELKQSR